MVVCTGGGGIKVVVVTAGSDKVVVHRSLVNTIAELVIKKMKQRQKKTYLDQEMSKSTSLIFFATRC